MQNISIIFPRMITMYLIIRENNIKKELEFYYILGCNRVGVLKPKKPFDNISFRVKKLYATTILYFKLHKIYYS